MAHCGASGRTREQSLDLSGPARGVRRLLQGILRDVFGWGRSLMPEARFQRVDVSEANN